MIEAQLAGRLGNQLFQYATARTVAEKNGYNWYVNPDYWLGGDLIKCDLGIKDGEIRGYFSDEPIQRFNPKIFDIPDFIQIQGFWQSEKYFDRDKVKEWFKITYNQGVFDFWLGNYQDYTCLINIRGTDQADREWLVLPKEYYCKAQKIMLMFNNKLRFVIITDDIELSKKYFPDLPIYSNDRDTDFCILNTARYVISGLSTFTWWATYLNDYNVVIAPRGWFAQTSKTDWQPQDIKTHKFIWI